MSTDKHYVYRLYSDKKLLYVGRSVNYKSRRRVFERRTGIPVTVEAVEFDCLELAQKEEINLIKRLKPPYNKYLASSPTRMGMVTTESHKAAISRALTGKHLNEQHKQKLWAERSRLSEDNPFYGKHHSEETKSKLRLKNLEQFKDPEKKERHRIASTLANKRRFGK